TTRSRASSTEVFARATSSFPGHTINAPASEYQSFSGESTPTNSLPPRLVRIPPDHAKTQNKENHSDEDDTALSETRPATGEVEREHDVRVRSQAGEHRRDRPSLHLPPFTPPRPHACDAADEEHEADDDHAALTKHALKRHGRPCERHDAGENEQD